MELINFVNCGTDERILKSLPVGEDCPEELVKAMNKQGLVQKEVTVQGANGKTFTRKQWVRVSDDQATSGSNQWHGKLESALNSAQGTAAEYEVTQVLKEMPTGTVIKTGQKALLASRPWEAEITYTKQADGSWQYISDAFDAVTSNNVSKSLCKVKGNSKFKLNVSTPSTTTNDQSTPAKNNSTQPDSKPKDQSQTASKQQSGTVSISFQLPDHGDAKKAMAEMLASGKSRDDIMSAAKAAGITWTANDNAGINWMRASMAIQKHMKSGSSQPKQGKFSPKDFLFRAGGQETVNMANELDALVGIKSHTNGAAGFGTFKCENGELVGFGNDKTGAYLKWHGQTFRSAKDLNDAWSGHKTSSTVTSAGKKPKIFTESGGIKDVTRGGVGGQYMIHRKSAKRYIMLQATRKDGSWGKPSQIELYGSETPEDALKRMQQNNPNRKWQFDPDSMED